jgi:integrase
MAIYKRKGSKYYWFKFVFDGELIQRSSKCSNKADARTVESAFRTQLALGKIGIEPIKEIPTFEKMIEDFLELSKAEHGERSQSRYRFACLPLKEFFGKTKADKIGSREIEKYIFWRRSQISKRTKEPIKRETVNKELTVLKNIFRNLADENILKKNPAKNIKHLPENDLSFHVITPTEEKEYLLACPQPLQDIAALILETGMRPDEVYRIGRDEVFLEKNYFK